MHFWVQYDIHVFVVISYLIFITSSGPLNISYFTIKRSKTKLSKIRIKSILDNFNTCLKPRSLDVYILLFCKVGIWHIKKLRNNKHLCATWSLKVKQKKTTRNRFFWIRENYTHGVLVQRSLIFIEFILETCFCNNKTYKYEWINRKVLMHNKISNWR